MFNRGQSMLIIGERADMLSTLIRVITRFMFENPLF